MPHCVAFECNVQAKNKQNDPKIRFRVFPRDNELRKAWIHVIGRTSLPKDPRLCSKHFEEHCFKESYLLELRVLGSSRMLNPLKPDAVPTLFSQRPAAPVRLSSVKRAEKRQKLEALIQTGGLQREPRFKISWSKVSKRFGAEPVLEKKRYEYLDDMLQAAFHLAASGTKPAPKVKDRSGVMCPAERPSRKEIIDTRQRLSRFK